MIYDMYVNWPSPINLTKDRQALKDGLGNIDFEGPAKMVKLHRISECFLGRAGAETCIASFS